MSRWDYNIKMYLR